MQKNATIFIFTLILSNDIFLEKVSETEFRYVGYTWTRKEGQLTTNLNVLRLIRENKSNQTIKNNLANMLKSPVRVSTFTFPPSNLIIRKNNTLTMGSYFGHLFDIFHTKFNVSFQVIECKEKQFGSYIRGRWTGTIGDLVYGIADVAPSLIITKQRRDFVAFSPELYPLQYDIIYRKLDHFEWNATIFLKPYQKDVWICIFALSLVVIFLRYLSNFVLRKNRFERNFSCFISEFLVCWPIVTQGTIPFSSTYSIKFCLGLYLIFSMLLLSIYSSLLTSLFATSKVKIPFTTFEEMLYKSDYVPVILKGSKIEEFFLRSAFKNQELLKVNSLKAGIDVVFNKKAGLLIPFADVQHMIHKNCSFSVAKHCIRKESIALAYAKQFVYIDYFNYKLLLLKECGILSIMREHYVPKRIKCTNSAFHSIPFGEMVGPFVIIFCGNLISLLIGAVELIVEKFIY